MIVVRYNFVWLVVPSYKAERIFATEVFELYLLHDDGSESLIESFDEIRQAEENGIQIGIEVELISKITEKFVWQKNLTKNKKK